MILGKRNPKIFPGNYIFPRNILYSLNYYFFNIIYGSVAESLVVVNRAVTVSYFSKSFIDKEKSQNKNILGEYWLFIGQIFLYNI